MYIKEIWYRLHGRNLLENRRFAYETVYSKFVQFINENIDMLS